MLDISQTDIVLEVGCGKGGGIIHAMQKYKLSYIHGIDVTPA